MSKRKTAADPVPAPTADDLSQLVCERVKAARKAKGWTLEQLASLSGVSRSMLSQIERGAANPTLGVAWRIAQAFGLALSDLVDAPQPAARIETVRVNDRRCLFRDDPDCRIRTLSPLHLDKDVEFYELTLKPGGALDSAPHFSETREFLTVQKGKVRVTSGEETQELAAGDSAHYPADIPHRLANPTNEIAIAFLVVIYRR